MSDPMISRQYDYYLEGEFVERFPTLAKALAYARKWAGVPSYIIEREYDGYFDFASSRMVWQSA